MITLLDAALTLNAKGFALFPLQPKGKTPVTRRGFHDASKDPALIKRWWTSAPECNIGLPTGSINGFFVLDVDGDEGEQSLAALEREHGALPPTLEVITASGRHIYLKMRGKIGSNVGQLGRGLDLRGDGSYVVSPPSIHPSGRPYTCSVDSSDLVAEPPQWLLDLIGITNTGAKGKPLEHWHKLLTRKIYVGERNATLTSLCGKYLHCGLRDPVLLYDTMLAVNAYLCEVPLSPEEIETIACSVVRKRFRIRDND